jgi:hypothetical protein
MFLSKFTNMNRNELMIGKLLMTALHLCFVDRVQDIAPEPAVMCVTRLNDELDVRTMFLQPLRNTNNIIAHDLPLPHGNEYMLHKPADVCEPVLRRLLRLCERAVGFGLALEQLRTVGPEYPPVQEVDSWRDLVSAADDTQGEKSPSERKRPSRRICGTSSWGCNVLDKTWRTRLPPAESPAT